MIKKNLKSLLPVPFYSCFHLSSLSTHTVQSAVLLCHFEDLAFLSEPFPNLECFSRLFYQALPAVVCAKRMPVEPLNATETAVADQRLRLPL